jgi:hypothetical protein
MIAIPAGALVALVAAWYLLQPGGYLNQRKAIDSVRTHTISLVTNQGAKDYTVEELIRDYDPNAGTLLVGGLLKDMRDLQDLPWQASYVGGKFAVGCTYRGRLYSFETDQINVTPVSDAAQKLFGLEHASFGHTDSRIRLPF